MTDLIDENYVSHVGEGLSVVRDRIVKAGGDLDAVTVVAVTKTFEIKACLAALSLGLSHLGENFANELVDKAVHYSSLETTIDGTPTWHFLGGIQRNKLGKLAPHVGVYESVDRYEEAVAIARHAPKATIYLEVKVHESETKGGVAPSDVAPLVEQCQELGLNVAGLMTVAPQGDPDGARHTFSTVRGLVDLLGLSVCSMGMTDDLEMAVQEGATHVRIGRALFGPRHAR